MIQKKMKKHDCKALNFQTIKSLLTQMSPLEGTQFDSYIISLYPDLFLQTFCQLHSRFETSLGHTDSVPHKQQPRNHAKIPRGLPPQMAACNL